MEKKRFYYLVVSFMRKDGVKMKTAVHSRVVGTEDEELKFYPIFKSIKSVEDFLMKFNIDAVPATILIENVTEISEEDYNALEERSVALKKEKEG